MPPRTLADATKGDLEQALLWRVAMLERVHTAQAVVDEAIAGAKISVERVIAERVAGDLRKLSRELEVNVRRAADLIERRSDG